MGLELERVRFRAMGSPCVLHFHAPSRIEAKRVADGVVGEVRRLEAKYSRYRDDSLVSAIVRSAGSASGIDVDDETASLLDHAATCFAQSAGRFDVTSGVLRRAWDFRSGRVPDQREVDAVLELVGWERVVWARPRLRLPRPGMELDLGGVVKEYAVDRCVGLLRDQGIEHALVDLGGDLGIAGPHPDGAPWTIGVRDPFERGEALLTIDIARGAVATSGDYERGMTIGDRRYTHVLDARTGWPVEGVASVTVVAPHCTVAGSVSTIAMLLGRERCGPWLADLGLPHVSVLADGQVAGTLAPRVAETVASRPAVAAA